MPVGNVNVVVPFPLVVNVSIAFIVAGVKPLVTAIGEATFGLVTNVAFAQNPSVSMSSSNKSDEEIGFGNMVFILKVKEKSNLLVGSFEIIARSWHCSTKCLY